VSPKQSSLKNSQNGPSTFKCIDNKSIKTSFNNSKSNSNADADADAEQNEKQITLFKTTT
jgi:hypothetical protein